MEIILQNFFSNEIIRVVRYLFLMLPPLTSFHIPVVSPKAIEEKNPDSILILAPLYADNIIDQNKNYISKGGKFIKIWPEFEIIKN